MDISAIQRPLAASDIPIEQLANSPKLSEDQKVAEATRQFEAILLRQILESTQKTVIHSKYSDDSTAAGIYRDMVSNQLADSISKSGSLGLSKTLEHELTRQLHSTSAGHDQKSEALPTARTLSDVARPLSRSAGHSQTISKLKEPEH